MYVRTIYFMITGALGGAVGFLLMELVRWQIGAGTDSDDLLQTGLQFSAFGLSVGSLLGMTEGIFFRNRKLLRKGLWIGGLLGLMGGFVGGIVGEWLYDRIPVEFVSNSRTDLVVALDSSGSMKHLIFFGNDPWGRRKEAAQHLADHLSNEDRLAVVDFDQGARVVFPLTRLGDDGAREQAKATISSIDSAGGTDLGAGLTAALDELQRLRRADRPQAVIFLTDGVGAYDPAITQQALAAGVTVYPVGLGSEIDRELLETLATTTGGHFTSVQDASQLINVFQEIIVQRNNMLETSGNSSPIGEQKTSPVLLWLARVTAWAAMGLLLGLGQGLWRNSWQDLWACGRGGALGGFLGGALFDVLSAMVGGSVSAIAGRAVADVAVGALIGGSMRLAQAATDRRLQRQGGEKTPILGGGLRIGDNRPGRSDDHKKTRPGSRMAVDDDQ